MIKIIDIELFRFDAKVDYLPYYKRYRIRCSTTDTVLDLLDKINDIEKFSYESSSDFNIKINDIFLNVKEPVFDVVELLGSEFKIEPMSIYRAKTDLLVDKEDYLDRISIFDKFVDSKELVKYLDNGELDYYASNTCNINRDYIGDHALLIAYGLIEDMPEIKQELLGLISKSDIGIWYHTSLENRVFNYDMNKEKKIKDLLNMLPKVIDLDIKETRKIDQSQIKITQYFDGFNIASYEGLTKDSCVTLINDSKANNIEISCKNEDLAPYSSLVNQSFSLKIAGEILLQAKDSNADFLIVRDKDDILLFDDKQIKIEREMGREIGMPIISQEQFIGLLGGEKDIVKLGLDTHKIKASFL